MSVMRAFRDLAGRNKDRLALAAAAGVYLVIVIAEGMLPANVVGAYGFVLPILLVATVRDRRLMVLTVALCVIATYAGLLTPTKPGRFLAALINRTVVVGVLIGVAYFAFTREQRKAREEAARAELAQQTENLLRANAQLVEIKTALGRSERLAAVGRLVASVAHEVGTPLHSIGWHVQTLAEEPTLTPEMRDRIAIIDSQITRVVRIIQDLLSSTRQRKPALARLTADELLQPVVALMAPAFTAKAVKLSLEPGTGVPAMRGDVEQLQQVLINLLSNALAATAAGGEVTVQVGEESGMVTIAVRDTGCGMPEEHVKRAFEPFFSGKAIGDGAGLGLYLSQEIMTAHRGTLSLSSEVGRGTTVRLALPVSVEADQEVPRSEPVGRHDGP
jgi:two-component system NtrC family sensor kinase